MKIFYCTNLFTQDYLDKLQSLDFDTNVLTGTLPEFTRKNYDFARASDWLLETIGSTKSLKQLYVNNNFFHGPIPQNFRKLYTWASKYRSFINSCRWIGNMSRMGLFYAYNNQFSGSIPSLFGKYFHIHIFQQLFSHNCRWWS